MCSLVIECVLYTLNRKQKHSIATSGQEKKAKKMTKDVFVTAFTPVLLRAAAKFKGRRSKSLSPRQLMCSL